MTLFLVAELPKHIARLGPLGGAFLQSGRLLLDFHSTLKALPVRLTEADAGGLLDTWKRFMIVVEPLEIYVPKSH